MHRIVTGFEKYFARPAIINSLRKAEYSWHKSFALYVMGPARRDTTTSCSNQMKRLRRLAIRIDLFV